MQHGPPLVWHHIGFTQTNSSATAVLESNLYPPKRLQLPGILLLLLLIGVLVKAVPSQGLSLQKTVEACCPILPLLKRTKPACLNLPTCDRKPSRLPLEDANRLAAHCMEELDSASHHLTTTLTVSLHIAWRNWTLPRTI
ncbi:hypothetical protein E2C01_010546 [Portunus trituberculatus]|uniref:Uncharacterized protein n=1 Tax=Portunus trituberculatus TaxID=210409 RepID=A0A5B7D8Z2_PORTR|nr:hypothetical protein [Portunus trituberculatus]